MPDAPVTVVIVHWNQPERCVRTGRAFAAQHGLSDASPEAMSAQPAALAEVEQGVQRANTHLSRVEQIKRFKLLPTDWAPGGDELTPTMKLKRKPIAEKYATEIEALYTRS